MSALFNEILRQETALKPEMNAHVSPEQSRLIDLILDMAFTQQYAIYLPEESFNLSEEITERNEL